MYNDPVTFWTNILFGIDISLVVSGIIGYFGFIVWKKRQLYSKKLVAYNSLVASLTLFCTEMSIFFEVKDKNETKIKEFIKRIMNPYGQLINEITNFVFYFGSEYQKPLLEIFNLYPNLRFDLEMNMTKDEFNKYISDRMFIILNSNKNIKWKFITFKKQ